MNSADQRIRFPKERYVGMEGSPLAPASYRNWLAFVEKRRYHGTEEYAVYTDARITGEITDDLGPYRIFNTVPSGDRSQTQIGMVLSIGRYLYPSPLFGMNHAQHHIPDRHVDAWSLGHELVALLSLCLGVATRLGGEMRAFYPRGYPEGRPRAFGIHAISLRPFRGGRRIIPSSDGPAALGEQKKLLHGFHKLTPDDAATLLRAARLYQDALWYADTMPDVSWLMLVQAAEAAARQWYVQEDVISPWMSGRWRRQLHEYLQAIPLPQGRVDEIARIIPPARGGPTRRFVSFILDHLSHEPILRPHPNFQMIWDDENWIRVLNNIYDRRCDLVHEGKPFPRDMCSVPVYFVKKENGEIVYAETPVHYEKKPEYVHLHVFADVVRDALLAWWEGLVESCGRYPN